MRSRDGISGQLRRVSSSDAHATAHASHDRDQLSRGSHEPVSAPRGRHHHATTPNNIVWHAMLDNDRDLIGMGQQEADAVYDLFCQITEREADDENDELRFQCETGCQS